MVNPSMDAVIRITLFSLVIFFAMAPQMAFSSTVAQASSEAERFPWLNGSCSVDVCFAVDGSGAVSDAEFSAQKIFIDRLSLLLGGNRNSKSKAGAVQFGLLLTPIAPMTSSRRAFRTGLTRTRKRGGQRAFVAAGLAYCVLQLQGRRSFALRSTNQSSQGHVVHNRRKAIVLIHNGKRGFGSGTASGPLRLFRGKVFAVAAGSADRAALEKITGDHSQVVVAQNFEALQSIAGRVAKKICLLA